MRDTRKMLKKARKEVGYKKQIRKSLTSGVCSPPALPFASFLTPMALAVALGFSAGLHAQADNACGEFGKTGDDGSPGEAAIECPHDADDDDSDAHTPYEDGIFYAIDFDEGVDVVVSESALSLTIKGGDAENPTVVGGDGTNATSSVTFTSHTGLSGYLTGQEFSDMPAGPNDVVTERDPLWFDVDVGDLIWIGNSLYRNTGEDVNGEAAGNNVFAELTIGTGQGETDPSKLYYQRADGKFVKAESDGGPRNNLLFGSTDDANVVDQSALDAVEGAIVVKLPVYTSSESDLVLFDSPPDDEGLELDIDLRLYASHLRADVAEGDPLIYVIGTEDGGADGANIIPLDVVLTVEEHVTIDAPGRDAGRRNSPFLVDVGIDVGNFLADLTVNHHGQIFASGTGIAAEAVYATSAAGDVVAATARVNSSGDITVMPAEDGSADGIYARSSATTVSVTGGTILVEGKADGGTASDPIIRAGIYAEGATSSTVTVADATITVVKPAETRDAEGMVTNQAELDAANAVVHRHGIQAAADGQAQVTIGEGATVSGGDHGIHIQGNERQTVRVDGAVTGGQGAAVNFGKIVGDDPVTAIGTQLTRLTVGTNGEVNAGSGTASKAVVAQAETGSVQVIVEADSKGNVGRIDGRIIHLGGDDDLEFIARVDGEDTALALGETKAVITRRGVGKGAFDGNEVLPFTLELADSTATGSARDWLFRTGEHSFDRENAVYAPRAHVYEALPSVLLSMNGLTSWRDRMAAPRDSKGVWVRLGAGSSEREADSSTSLASGVAYDLSSQTAQVGGDFTVDAVDNVLLGLSLHHSRGDADVDSGGDIDVTGQGVGFSATYVRENGLYLDGQLQMTWFNDVELTSDTRGDLSDDAEGSGHAFGIELGQAITKGNRVITPRMSLTWSSVDFDDFAVMFGEDDGGQVSLKDGDVFSGSIGVMAEIAFRESSGFFVSADFEHSFGSDTSVAVSDDRLSSDIAEDWVHFSAGWFIRLGEASSLQATANYSSASGNNDVLAGSVKFIHRF